MVPITSAGSRSGVNWIRENAMRRHSATVRTASVLASPGTPSSRTCPPVSKPMSRRSTIRSCATTRFATSRAIVWLSTASPVFAVRVVILAGGAPSGGGGAKMTTRTATTGEAVVGQASGREGAQRGGGGGREGRGATTGVRKGVPGLAKTLAVRTVAECLRIAFSRIQFTPDLLPADVIGTMVFDQKTQEFYPKKGPLFANLVLADEINRAPAKVQAALLEAMQEKQVTIGGETFFLGEPFLVLATQNPIEQEGTYPLPEAQLDRFMLKVRVGYPTRDAEKEIVARMASGRPIEVQRVAEADDILAARGAIAELFIDQKVVDYIVDVVRGTREPQAIGLPELKPLIAFGASPRASIYLAQAARAHAFLRGRSYVVPEDVKAMAFDVLRHRVLLTFEAEAEDMDSDRVIGKILEAVGVP